MNRSESVIIKSIHTKLVSHALPNGEIDRKKLLGILGRNYHVPREFKLRAIEELKEKGIIISSNKFSFIIKR